MTPDLAWLIVALVLGLIGWGMTRLTLWAARTRVTEGAPWIGPSLASIPAIALALVTANFLIGVWIDPTSNNLWPLMYAALLALWLAYIVAVRLVLWICGYFTAVRH